MAIDYNVVLEGDVDFASFLARFGQQIQFTLEKCDGRELRLKEASEMFRLYSKRGLSEEEGEPYNFDNPNIDFLPKAAFSIRLNKFRGVEPNIFLARVIRVILDCTPGAVTVLMNGETLMLRRKSGEVQPTVGLAGFWAESEVQMLLGK